MKIEIISYEPWHAYAILEKNVQESDVWLTEFPEWERCAQGWKEAGPSYTMMIDGQPAGCAGTVLIDWNRAEAWMLLSSLALEYRFSMVKAVKKFLRRTIAEKGLRRVQALVRPDFEAAQRFIERLGFKAEGLLRAYGPRNEDLIMYARVE